MSRSVYGLENLYSLMLWRMKKATPRTRVSFRKTRCKNLDFYTTWRIDQRRTALESSWLARCSERLKAHFNNSIVVNKLFQKIGNNPLVSLEKLFPLQRLNQENWGASVAMLITGDIQLLRIDDSGCFTKNGSTDKDAPTLIRIQSHATLKVTKKLTI